MTEPSAPELLAQTNAGAETLRLVAFSDMQLLNTPMDRRFERIIRLADKVINAPMVAITLLHQDQEWFKSTRGLDITRLPLELSLGSIANTSRKLVTISDTRGHERARNCLLVAQSPFIRSYVGIPLFEAQGKVVGTFTVMDMEPRPLQSFDMDAIEDLAAIAQDAILSDQLNDAQEALTHKLGAARREALIDPLTRVWNRRGGGIAMKMLFTDADATGKSVVVGLVDIDRFKTINDTHGHDVGDIVLQRVADLLISNLSEKDIVCRLGGDEFLFIVADHDGVRAREAIERVRQQLEAEPITVRDGQVSLTISAGYTMRPAGAARAPEEMILLADQALIASKTAGRNQVLAAS